MSIRKGIIPRRLDGAELRKRLIERGGNL